MEKYNFPEIVLKLMDETINFPQTFYEALSISRYATKKDITKAYHRKMRHFHPDTYVRYDLDQLSLKIVLEISKRWLHTLREAYETLKDPEKRRKYDQSLQSLTPLIGHEIAKYNDTNKSNFVLYIIYSN